MTPPDAGLARRRRTNAVMFGLAAVCTAVALSVLFVLLAYITWKGVSSLTWAFLSRLPRPVGEPGGGIAHAIVGTVKLVGLAAVLGVPVGVLGATYLSEYGSNRFGFAIRYCADVLNGIPSIVTGIFAFTVVVLPLKHFSALAGSVALAVIMIPLVLRSSEEFLRLVPVSVREAALALGVPRWKVIARVVLPTASRGIMTGSLLAVSRVAGETAPLVFTAFGARHWDQGWLQPIAALPLVIYSYAISPYEDWHRQAWAAAFLLLIVVLAGNLAARALMQPRQEGTGS
ncbi:MAG: phosphate ABC transporter permease PstA [Candidatus Coatesbacteria bacterium]